MEMIGKVGQGMKERTLVIAAANNAAGELNAYPPFEELLLASASSHPSVHYSNARGLRMQL